MSQSQSARLEDIILFLVSEAPEPLGITQLMKLVYLADVEHVRLYGTSLTGAEWTWYHHGPFTPAVYGAVEELDEAGIVRDVIAVSVAARRNVVPINADFDRVAVVERLGPRAYRAVTRVLERYRGLSLAILKAAAYDTAPMKGTRQGERLDLSREPRTSKPIPGVAEFLERAPAPDFREWGDPEASAAEDLVLLREFSGLRREANQVIE